MSVWPAAYVDIWAAAGGVYNFDSTDGSLLAVTTSKDIWEPDSGTFDIALPPGGPNGADGAQWSDIITPMSLVIIGLQRSVPGAVRAHIVMIGVVTHIEQSTTWRFGDGVRRVARVSGRDFSYFFSRQNLYNTTLLQMTGVGLGGLESALVQAGIASGTPAAIGLAYFYRIMAGTGGIMANTRFAYNSGTVTFPQIVETAFAEYPTRGVDIPFAWNFLAQAGTWNADYTSIFPWPWYEYNIITSEPGQYAAQTTTAGTFSINNKPFLAAANPLALARPMPLPRLTVDGGTGALSLDMSAWNALPVVQPDDSGFAILDSRLGFDCDAVRNFYVVNPSNTSSLYGNSNGNIAMYMLQFASWLDATSIEQYGYSPRIDNLQWFCDPIGNQAQQNASSQQAFAQTVGDVALVPVSYHEPAALMASGSLTLNLRPDIAPGVRVQFVNDKSGTLWLGYVRSVSHRFEFGQPSTTTLGVCRALPLNVYQNPQLLLAMHIGQGERVDGVYTIDTSAAGIKPFTLRTAGQQLAAISRAYSTPGAR